MTAAAASSIPELLDLTAADALRFIAHHSQGRLPEQALVLLDGVKVWSSRRAGRLHIHGGILAYGWQDGTVHADLSDRVALRRSQGGCVLLMAWRNQGLATIAAVNCHPGTLRWEFGRLADGLHRYDWRQIPDGEQLTPAAGAAPFLSGPFAEPMPTLSAVIPAGLSPFQGAHTRPLHLDHKRGPDGPNADAAWRLIRERLPAGGWLHVLPGGDLLRWLDEDRNGDLASWRPELRAGARSPWVKRAQELLSLLDQANPLPQTGVFGWRTTLALSQLRAFQRDPNPVPAVTAREWRYLERAARQFSGVSAVPALPPAVPAAAPASWRAM